MALNWRAGKGRWEVDWWEGKSRKRKFFTEKREAARFHRLRKTRMVPEIMTLHKLLDAFAEANPHSIKGRRLYNWRQFKRALPDTIPTARQLQAYINQRLKNIAPISALNELSFLRQIYRWGQELGYVIETPTHKVTLPRFQREREYYLTPEQQEALLQGAITMADIPLASAVLIALTTGMRQCEVMALKIQDIDHTAAIIRVKTAKNDLNRILPMGKDLSAWLQEHPSPDARVVPITTATLKNHWTKLKHLAGLPHVRFHDLRHTFASSLINSGYDISFARKLLGHKSPISTFRYAHPGDEALALAVANIAPIETGRKIITAYLREQAYKRGEDPEKRTVKKAIANETAKVIDFATAFKKPPKGA